MNLQVKQKAEIRVGAIGHCSLKLRGEEKAEYIGGKNSSAKCKGRTEVRPFLKTTS